MSTASPHHQKVSPDAMSLGQHLLRQARHGALGVICPHSGGPLVTRISVGTAADGMPVTLISEISQHTNALKANPTCSLLVGEPGGRGDPLTHPRLTLQCTAKPVDKDGLKTLFLEQHPKAKLYYDFSDFLTFRLEVIMAHLNGGFGKAYTLSPFDLDLANCPNETAAPA